MACSKPCALSARGLKIYLLRKMVDHNDPHLNQFFENLAAWEEQLKDENIDFEELGL